MFGCHREAYRVAVADPGGPLLIAVLGRGVVPADQPAVVGDDLGLTRGDGCFDAMRLEVRPGGPVVHHFEGHLARFQRSAAELDIPVDIDAWRALIDEAICAWPHAGEAVLRVMLSRGRELVPSHAPHGVLTIAPVDQRAIEARDGLTAITLGRGYPARAFAGAPWLLGGVKTLSYAINVASAREAARRGAGDALWVSTDGLALEAPRSALVWASGDTLSTSSLDDTGILMSVTQQEAFAAAEAAGVRTEYTLIAPERLLEAESAWLVSSIRGPVPLLALDGHPVPRSERWHARMLEWCGFR